MNEPRSYNSPSRDQAKVDTRDAILEATVKVILEEGIALFTMQNVAKVAGVAHRTVYRHFDSREALLEGLQDMLYERQAKAGLVPPKEVSRFVEVVGLFFEEFSREADAMRASVIAATALRHQTRLQSQSFAIIERALRDEFEYVPASEIRDSAAAIRSITGRYGWYVMAVDMELTGKECGRAVSFAVRAMVRDLERRNAELAPGGAKAARAAARRLVQDEKRPAAPKSRSRHPRGHAERVNARPRASKKRASHPKEKS
jgi:AcrR family transcriptional regulator